MRPAGLYGLAVIASVGVISLAVYGFWILRSIDLAGIKKLNSFVSSITSKVEMPGMAEAPSGFKISFPLVASVVLFVAGIAQLVMLRRS